MQFKALSLLASVGLLTACAAKSAQSNDPGAVEYDGYYGEEGGGGGAGGDGGGGAADPNGPGKRDVLGTRGADPRKGKKLTAKKPPRKPTYVPPAKVALPKLGVSGFVPTIAAPGTAVVIHGGGFSTDAAKNTVKVGGVKWEVLEATEGAIVAKVPNGAKSGAVEVKVGKKSAKSEATFGALSSDDTFGRSSTQATRGLLADVYVIEGEVSELPAFDDLGGAIGTMAVDTLDIGTGSFRGFPHQRATRNTWFALHFKGSLNVTEAGEYDLCLESDDGAQLYLEQNVIVDNDGVHEATEKCELVYMDPGEYSLDLLYFQAQENVALKFSWARDGGDKAPVPADVLFPPE